MGQPRSCNATRRESRRRVAALLDGEGTASLREMRSHINQEKSQTSLLSSRSSEVSLHFLKLVRDVGGSSRKRKVSHNKRHLGFHRRGTADVTFSNLAGCLNDSPTV